ncbi:MAG: NAD-dependent epimerase/dehydratase family protein [Kiritimatiellae bacterium]|nr:NAD-dependent epimerase/dehydratase family protein [Kiritimatiellia bacterium]
MKVFVTGGAGFLGINLVRALKARGAEKIAVYDIAPFDYPEKGEVECFREDIRDFPTLLEAMKGYDCVVHCAAALPLYTEDEIRSTDVDGVRNVFEAALRNGAKRCVHISSTAVYGVPDHHPLLETDELVGVGPYGRCKVEVERDIVPAFRSRGLCIPVLRPKSFVGPERLGVFALLYDWAYTGHGFPIIGDGSNPYQLLDVDDLCDAIYACLTLPAADVDDVFNIGAAEYGTMREDWQAVLDRAGYGKKIKGFPARPVIAALRFLEKIHLSPLYAWVYETACKESFVSIDKAKAKLGFAPKYSNRDALVRNYDWYADHVAEFAGKSGVSHRVPWKQGALALAKLFF